MDECFAPVFTTSSTSVSTKKSVSAKGHVTHKGVYSRKKADYAQILCMDAGTEDAVTEETVGRRR